MSYQQVHDQGQSKNGMAITSLVIGIISWLLFLVLLCLNYIILPLFTLATMGVGGIFYICTLTLGCLSPFGWLIGTVLGHTAKNQIKQAGLKDMGLANAAFIINAIGLGLILLGLCAGVAYIVFVGGLGGLTSILYMFENQ